jgi:hypothetical protein
MFDLNKTLVDGGLLTVVFTVMILVALFGNKRWFLSKKNIPADIFAVVPHQTAQEKRTGLLVILPFFTVLLVLLVWSVWSLAQAGAGFGQLYTHAFVIMFFPFIVDLLVFDWLIMNTWTPSFVVYPGTEGFAGYKDYMFHARAHVRGLVGLLVFAALIAGSISLLA